MAGSLGTVGVDFEARTRNFNRALDNMTRRMNRLSADTIQTQSRVSTSTVAMGNAWAMMGQMAVRAIGEIVSATAEIIKTSATMAIRFENNMGQVEKIFGSASDSIVNFADNQARALGMSTSDAIEFARVYGRMTTGIIGDQAKSAEITQQLLKQSAVVASATGRSMDDVMTRITSGLRGETEAIEDLQIEVTASMLKTTKAFRKFAGDKSWNQLDDSTRKQIRLFGILEQSMKIGTSIQDTTSASLQRLSATLEDAALQLGQAFLPIIQRTVPILIKFAETLVDVGEKIRLFSNYLFEVEEKEKMLSNSGEDVANSQDDVSKSINKAAASARKSLAPFDKLNNLQEKVAAPSTTTTKTKTSDTTKGSSIFDDNFIGPKVGTGKKELSAEMKEYIDGMKAGFKEVQGEAQNNRKWLKDFWKTSIFTDADAKALFSTSGFKTYSDLWERFYNEPLQSKGGGGASFSTESKGGGGASFSTESKGGGGASFSTQTANALQEIDTQYNTFFSGLQQKPWSDVKMNWFTGMQNIKNTMDIVLSRMDKNVDSHIEGIKNKDWTGVQTEWDNSWGDIRTDIDTQLGNIETDVQDTTLNIQEEVRKMKAALASVGASTFNGVPISRNGPSPIRLDPSSSNDINTDFLGSGNVGTDTASNLTQVQGNNLPSSPVEVKVNLDGREIAKGIFDPLQKESERRGSSVITRQNPSPFLK